MRRFNCELRIANCELIDGFAIPLLAQCEKIAQLDGITTPEEAKVIETISKKFGINIDSLRQKSV